jgi:hypothetical protein
MTIGRGDVVGARGGAGQHGSGFIKRGHVNVAARGTVVWSGGATGSVWEGKEQRGGVGHMGQSGSRRRGRPGEAAHAAKGFGPRGNENIETLWYLVWISIK